MEFFVAYAITALIIAFVTKAIADDKGRDGWTFFVLALFIGIFALILVACLSRRENSYLASSSSSGWYADYQDAERTGTPRHRREKRV